jgi:hypothetical protein
MQFGLAFLVRQHQQLLVVTRFTPSQQPELVSGLCLTVLLMLKFWLLPVVQVVDIHMTTRVQVVEQAVKLRLELSL